MQQDGFSLLVFYYTCLQGHVISGKEERRASLNTDRKNIGKPICVLAVWV